MFDKMTGKSVIAENNKAIDLQINRNLVKCLENQSRVTSSLEFIISKIDNASPIDFQMSIICHITDMRHHR